MTAEPVPVADLRRSPLESMAPAMAAAGQVDTVRIRELPFLAMVDLRLDTGDTGDTGDTAVLNRVELAVGLPVPVEPCRASRSGARAVLWLGPGWWLVVGEPGTEARTAAALRDAVGAAPGSVVDVSAWRTTVELAGPAASELLMTGCPVDLHPRAFPAGGCVQTLLARAPVIVECAGVAVYRLSVRSSLAGYLGRWLLDAAAELS